MSWNGTWYGPAAGGGGGGTGTGTIVVLSPSPGQISDDPDVARWTPLTATIELRDGDNLYAFFYSKVNGVPSGTRFTIYDPDNGFAALYDDRSDIVAADSNPDTDAPRKFVTILPNGGWQSEEFHVTLVTGVEMPIE